MRLVLVALLVVACRPPGYGREDHVDAAVDGHPGDGSSHGVDAAVDSPAAATCDHAFRLDGQATASSVYLTGNFVNWAATPPGAIAFTLGNDGAWTGHYAFAAGSWQYKFIINGSTWILDPTNPNTADDGMGHTNSVYTCQP